MPDIVAAGQPFQSSPEVAASIYSSTPPSFSRGFGALFSEDSSIEAGVRATQRGEYAGASAFDRGLTVTGLAEAGLPVPPPIETPELSAAEANERYAPKGTKITNQPMREGIAALVGKAKADQIERENVISRFQSAHSAPTNFLTGMAAFTLDPLNSSTMLIPGFGEESVAARLGGGFLARTAGRAVGGATAAGLSQVPLTALKYGLGQEEVSDYEARDALRDIFYSAAGGAVLNAGIAGPLREMFAARVERQRAASRATIYPEPIGPYNIERQAYQGPIGPPTRWMDGLGSDTRFAAMKSALSQIMDGRAVDVMPVIDADGVRLASREAQLRAEANDVATRLAAMSERPEESAAVEKLSRLAAVERNLADENISAEQRRNLMTRRDELLADTNPETLRAQAAPAEERRALVNQQSQIAAQLSEVAAQRTQRQAMNIFADSSPVSRLAQLADNQRQMYRNGYAQSVPQTEFDAVNEAIYGVKTEAAEKEAEAQPAAKLTKPPEAAKPQSVTFKTAKGSTYQVHEDGTTTRNKAARPEHPGEQGPQPRSEATFYVTKDEADKLSLIQTQGESMSLENLGGNQWGVKFLSGKFAGKFSRDSVVTPKTEPAKGLLPVEVWKDGARVHFGNEITEVSESAQRAAAFGEPKAEAKPPTPEEKDAADLEAQWQRLNETRPVKLTDDQRADIQAAIDEYTKAQSEGEGVSQAGVCLNEAGV